LGYPVEGAAIFFSLLLVLFVLLAVGGLSGRR
jgi:hypothetical protein